jgi:hypothetical protein
MKLTTAIQPMDAAPRLALPLTAAMLRELPDGYLLLPLPTAILLISAVRSAPSIIKIQPPRTVDQDPAGSGGKSFWRQKNSVLAWGHANDEVPMGGLIHRQGDAARWVSIEANTRHITAPIQKSPTSPLGSL